MKLSIGPIPYFWARQRVFDFYEQLADSPADVVYLGEVVCSKRREVRPDDWILIGRKLRDSGKEVVLSSLTLIEAASEVGSVRKLCANDEFTVEANDMTAVQLLSAAGKAFVCGPGINIYNHRSLRLLAGKGMQRWVLPVELGLDTLRDLQAARPDGVETEVFALGGLPLAYSARCYTARSHNLPKDDCRFTCLDYPSGRVLETREGEAFLVLNGTQTQSARTHETLSQVPDLDTAGVDLLRISPRCENTLEILGLFDSARCGSDPQPLHEKLLRLLPEGVCNGYLLNRAGMAHDDSQAA